VVGDPQRGSSCSLSANSGLPALSVPAGFTEDGLPIGIELVGRTLDDARLVALGYAFEQATDHRREPSSAPPLVNGEAPAAVTLHVTGRGIGYEPAVDSGVELRALLTLRPERGVLEYDVEVVGVSAADVHAVVLRHPAEEGGWLVARHISGPGTARTTGTLSLDASLLRRLAAGEVVVEAFTRGHPLGAARAALPPFTR
jgi:hypothetical protein